MSFIRSTTMRASAFARCARPTRYIRTAELQPWQRSLQRRTYASAHGSEAKKSDLPWIAGSLAATSVGLYLVLNQDLGHGEEHHDEAHAKHDEEHGEDESEGESSEEPAKSEESEESKESKDDEKDESKEDKEDKKDESEDKSEDDKEDKKDEPKGDSKEEKNKKDDAGAKTSAPDERDAPNPRKEAGSQNETSGKQEGLSNSDTKHTANIHDDPQKSKKGEGVAETAKLKGTVSTERPSAENKAERAEGKAQSDKDA